MKKKQQQHHRNILHNNVTGYIFIISCTNETVQPTLLDSVQVRGQQVFFNVRDFCKSQGNSKFLVKVSEKSGNRHICFAHSSERRRAWSASHARRAGLVPVRLHVTRARLVLRARLLLACKMQKYNVCSAG